MFVNTVQIMLQCLWTQFNHDAMFVNTVQSWCNVVVHSSDQDAMFMSIVQIMMQWFINSSEHVIDMFCTLLKSRCNVCELSSNHEAMYQCRCTHFRTRLYNISSGKERWCCSLFCYDNYIILHVNTELHQINAYHDNTINAVAVIQCHAINIWQSQMFEWWFTLLHDMIITYR